MTSDRLEERIEHLERQNRQMRLIALLLCSFIAACFAMGAIQKPQSPTTSKVVRTERLEIIGPDGKINALLAIENGAPMLKLYDNKKKERLTLGVSDGEPGLAVLRANGKPAIVMDVFEREYGTEPEPALVFYDIKGKPRAEMMLVAVDEDPELNMYDQKEKLKVELSVLSDIGNISLYDADGKAVRTIP